MSKQKMMRRLFSISILLSLVSLPLLLLLFYPAIPSAAASIQGLHVVGNQIRNDQGQPVRLLGVNRSGGEYMCIQNNGIWDGPMDAASVQAILAWHTNAIRIPLNEDCWLNINGVNPAYGGANYQQAVIDYVNLLNSYGLIPIVELHWSAPGTTAATGQNPMPDSDHSPAFWQSVANTFKGNTSVIFDLFNEPYPDSNSDTTAGWTCWRDGGTCAGISYQVAGFQTLVTTVRNTGATNVIILGGLQYSNALSQWLTFKPFDPTGNLGAAWHSYNFNICSNTTCWNNFVLPVLQQVPLIAGEIGENDCAHGYIDSLMSWLDSHNTGYLAWTWDAWPHGCRTGPVLITDYTGTTTAYGQGYKDHLTALSQLPTPTPLPTITAGPSPTPTPTPGPTATPGSINLALNKLTTVSSSNGASNTGAQAVDGNISTYWRTLKNDGLTSEWITVDLGSTQTFSRVVLKWNGSYATAYTIRVSPDNTNWTTVFTRSAGGTGGTETLNFNLSSARYVQMNSTAWVSRLEHIWLNEMEVY